MQNKKLKVNKFLQFLFDNNIEIVSYGLAPNPNGFCYEIHNDKTPKPVLKFVNETLDSLTRDETAELREIVFGT